MTENDRPFGYETVAVLLSVGWGTATIFLMPVGYTAAWVFGIPTGESHALIAGLTGGALIFCSVFGLLSGATLGGNCTPIGASANIAGIGILRKKGYTVKNSDFFKIGILFALVAIIPAYIYLWLMYGI